VGDAEDRDRRHEQRDDRGDRKHPSRSPAAERSGLDRNDHGLRGDVADSLTGATFFL
jgi:hypothetical protein